MYVKIFFHVEGVNISNYGGCYRTGNNLCTHDQSVRYQLISVCFCGCCIGQQQTNSQSDN